MGGFIQLRADLIKQLVTHGLTNFKVMDACCPANCSLTADVSERIAEMKKITAKDGVHFVDAGYQKIAERVTACMEAMLTGDSNATSQRKPWFISGVVSAVRGDRCCPEWATAITTHFPTLYREVLYCNARILVALNCLRIKAAHYNKHVCNFSAMINCLPSRHKNI